MSHQARKSHERRNEQSYDVLAKVTAAIEEARYSNDTIPLHLWSSLPGDNAFMKLRILDSHMDEDEIEVFAPPEHLAQLVEEPVQSISLSNRTYTLSRREDTCGASKEKGDKPCKDSKLASWPIRATQYYGAISAFLIGGPYVLAAHFDGLRHALQAYRRLRAEWRITDGRNHVGNGPRLYQAIEYARDVKREQNIGMLPARAYNSNTGKITVGYKRSSKSTFADDAKDKQWGCIFAADVRDMVTGSFKLRQQLKGMQHGGTWWGIFDYCLHGDGGPSCPKTCGFGAY